MTKGVFKKRFRLYNCLFYCFSKVNDLDNIIFQGNLSFMFMVFVFVPKRRNTYRYKKLKKNNNTFSKDIALCFILTLI